MNPCACYSFEHLPLRGTMTDWQTSPFPILSCRAKSGWSRGSRSLVWCAQLGTHLWQWSLWSSLLRSWWKRSTKCNRTLESMATGKTTGKGVCCTIHSHTAVCKGRSMRRGSKGKELCVLENCLSNHVSINKSLFLHSGKIIHHLLIINSIILHTNTSNTSEKYGLAYVLMKIFSLIKGH